MTGALGRRRAGGIAGQWWLILTLTLLGASAGYARSVFSDPVYQASSSLLVGRPLTDADVDQNTIETSQRLAATYADLVGRQPVLEGAAQQVGLDVPWQEVRSRVHASVPGLDSPVVVIRVDAPSAAEATELADAVNAQVIALSPTTSEDQHVIQVRAFVEGRLQRTQESIARLQVRTTRLRGLVAAASGSRLADLQARIVDNETYILDLQQSYASLLGFVSSGGVTNYIEVLEPPEAGSEPVSPNLPLDLAQGAAIGLIFGVVIAYAVGARRRRTRSSDRGSTSGPESAGDADRLGFGAGSARGSQRPL